MAGDRRAPVLVVSIAIFVTASLFVTLRFVSRIFVVKRIALHDYLMLLAWVVDFGFCFSLFYATSKGLGLHEQNISPAKRPGLSQAEYAFTVLYNPALMTVKTSILVFYLTLTSTDRIFRWANWITLFVVNAAGLILTFINIFQCSPVQAAFHYPTPSNARCINIITLYLSSAPVNIITDLAILFLPMPLLTQIRLPRKQKIILIITFSFGFFATIVDVVRVVYLQEAATDRKLALQSVHLQNGGTDDLSWYASLSFMWSVVEVNVCIICACVPSLKPLVARILPKMIKDTDDSTGYAMDTPASARGRPAAAGDAAAPRPRPSSPSRPDSNGSKESPAGSGSSESQASRRELEGPMDLTEFLGGSDARPMDTETTSGAYPPDMTFVDFVNMKTPASMLKLNNKESIPPIALVTILFFMWGFAYGFLDILNSQFATILNLSNWQSLGLHGAYYGGYLTGPLTVGRPVLKKGGFKATFITGLCVYACGSLIFWPSAVLTSFGAFTTSNFIVGFGLAILETAANPFIALCGPLENSEIRLTLSQGVQAIGSVLSPLLAKKVLFKKVKDVSALVDVQWTYLAIALFDVLLAVAFYYLPIPEASDEDLIELANRRREDNDTKVMGIKVVWVTLALGVWSQFFYVAGQEVLGTSFELFIEAADLKSEVSSFEYLTIGHTLFAFGRFLTAFTMWFFKPRWTLLISYIGLIVFSILCTKTSGSTAVAMALLIFLFESGAFSVIFAISLRGTAQHTKTAASLLATAIGGGVFFPFAQHAAALSHSGNGSGNNSSSSIGTAYASFNVHVNGNARFGLPYSYNVLVALFSAGAIFPVYLNLVPAAKKQVDPVPNEYIRRHHRHRHRHRHKHRQSQDHHHHHGGEKHGHGDGHRHGSDAGITAATGAAGASGTRRNTSELGIDVVHREKDNPARGGVLSRPRSLVEDPWATVQLPDVGSQFDADGVRQKQEQEPDRNSRRSGEDDEPAVMTCSRRTNR